MFSFFHYQINLKIKLLEYLKSLKKNFIRNIFIAKAKEVKFDVKIERLLLCDPAIDHWTAQIRDYKVNIFTCDVTEALMPTPMAGRISTWN